MAVATQQQTKDDQLYASTTVEGTDPHLIVGRALSESRLLERVREFRRQSREYATVDGGLSELELSHKAQSMLTLKNASEQFQSMLAPADAEYKRILQQLELEQVLHSAYWHNLFLANSCSDQGKPELDQLCSRLLDAKYALLKHEGVSTDLPVNETSGQKSYLHKPSTVSSINSSDRKSPELTMNKPIDEASTEHVQAEADLNKDHQQTDLPLRPARDTLSGVVTGVCALLLLVLTVSVAVPGLLQWIQAYL